MFTPCLSSELLSSLRAGTIPICISVISYTVFGIKSSLGWLGCRLLRSTWASVRSGHAHKCDVSVHMPPCPPQALCPALRSCSVTPWEDSTLWWESSTPMICVHSVQSVTWASKLSKSLSKSLSVPCMGNVFRLGAPGHGPTFPDAVVTTWPSAGGTWVPATSGLPLDQNDSILCLASVMWPLGGAGQVTGELELFLRRLLAQSLLLHCPSSPQAPFSMPRLRALKLEQERKQGHSGEGEFAKWLGRSLEPRTVYSWPSY